MTEEESNKIIARLDNLQINWIMMWLYLIITSIIGLISPDSCNEQTKEENKETKTLVEVNEEK